jgi:hypothetical protein
MRRWIVVAVALALVLTGASAALGAEAAAPAEMDVQMWPGAQAGQVVVIVSQRLPESAQLPATVRLPVPAGMNVDWAGEIAGADASQDPTRPYTLKQGEGGQYAELEISESRQAQIELSGIPLSVEGSVFTAVVEYVQSVPSQAVGFSVRLPNGAAAQSIEPLPVGEPDRNEVGETLYTLPSKNLKPGESIRLSASYQLAPSVPVPAQPASTDPTNVIVVLAVLLVAAAVALLLVLRRQRAADQTR